MPNTFEQTLPAIKDLILKQEFTDAYRQLNLFLTYPGTEIQADEDFKTALELFIQIAKGLKSEKLVPLVDAVVTDMNSANLLYDLAYECYEESLYGFAATLLKRAELFLPQHERIVTELVVNLEHIGMNDEAVRILEKSKELLELSFFSNYLLAFNSILSGNIEMARTAYKKADELHDSNNPDQLAMVKRIKLFLDRIDTLASVSKFENTDLRMWNFIINGSVILYRSPHGLKDGMNGRFAFVQDSASMIHTGINLLQAALKGLKLKPEHLFYINNQKSETLAKALATEMKMEPKLLTEANKETPGLIVVYDLREIPEEDYKRIGPKRDGQYIWAQASSWTEEDTYNPDFVTFVYQHNISPWEEQMTYTKDQEMEKKAAFGTNMKANVEEILKASLEDEKEQQEGLDKFTKKLNQAFKGKEMFTYLNNVRQRKWRGSPVKSSYFI